MAEERIVRCDECSAFLLRIEVTAQCLGPIANIYDVKCKKCKHVNDIIVERQEPREVTEREGLEIQPGTKTDACHESESNTAMGV